MTIGETVVLVASPLEPMHVERMRSVDPGVVVVHRPDLVGTPRYIADHDIVIRRTPQQQAEWDSLLREADVLFDFDKATPVGLEQRAPRLRWIQATSSGVGAYIEKAGMVDSRIIVTNAAGIHAVPLAEFVLMTTLMLTRGMLHAQENQRLHRWERFTTPELTGRVMLVVGVGRVGTEVARRARSFGLRVIGVKRDIRTARASEHQVDELIGAERLAEALPRADVVVLALPLTVHTRHLIGDSELRRRFVTERQILASLNHENIVRLLDGGTTATALPLCEALARTPGVSVELAATDADGPGDRKIARRGGLCGQSRPERRGAAEEQHRHARDPAS